jgi:p-hydroxybenzoate 3-monooxygenase
VTRTQVGIIGAGPSGLLLARLLHLQGIDSVIVERQSKEHVLGRIRAGVLEQGMADLLREARAGRRMDEEGLVHEGIHLAFSGGLERIDLAEHTGGKSVIIYGQTELTLDLVLAHLAAGGQIHYNAPAVAVEDYNTDSPCIIYEQDGRRREIHCDFVAGCDGYYCVARQSVPA